MSKEREDIVYEGYFHGAKFLVCDNPNTEGAVVDIVSIGRDGRAIVVPLDKDKLFEVYSELGKLIEDE